MTIGMNHDPPDLRKPCLTGGLGGVAVHAAGNFMNGMHRFYASLQLLPPAYMALVRKSRQRRRKGISAPSALRLLLRE